MMNISINRFFIVLALIYGFIIIVALNSILHLRQYQQEYLAIQKQFHQMTTVADVLRQSSDDLTRFARQYVVTGDPSHKEAYETILNIRNGLAHRPENYHYIYWDLLEPIRSQRHPDGAKRSLESMMKTLPFDRYDHQKLSEAQKNSDDLVNLEIEAFNAMIGLYKDENGHYARYGLPDQKKAIALLHSSEYAKAKERIMLPIDEFLLHMNTHEMAKVGRMEEKIQSHLRILILSGAMLLLAFLTTVYAINKKFLAPVKYLATVFDRFKKGEPLTSQERFYDDEFGDMIHHFFAMKEKIENDFALMKKQAYDIQEYVNLMDQNVITSSTDLSGTITYASEAFARISGYSVEELLGKDHSILRHPDMPKELYKELWNSIMHDKIWRGEIKNLAKNGDFYWVAATIYPKYDPDGKKVGYTAIRIDVTAQKQVEALLKEAKVSEKRIQEYVSLVDKNVLTSSTDLAGRIAYVSEAFARISGYTKEELLGKSHSIVRHPDMPETLYEEMWDTITQNRTWHGEIKNQTKNGGFYWVDATVYPIFDIDGNKTGYTAVRIDITAKKRVEDLLITDALTGIPNRRYFNEMLPKKINHTKRDRKYFSLMIMDVDHFKHYNDTYGHQEGDYVLTQVAGAIQGSLHRASDFCFRIGGEEFAVLSESLDSEEAFRFADQIRQNVENLAIAHEKNTASKYVTVSIGLLTTKVIGEIDPDTLYKQADDLLYAAKHNGRNRVETNRS